MKRPIFSLAGTLLLAAFVTMIVFSAATLNAQSETVIYTFKNNTVDGGFPTSGLVADRLGNLYGVTATGGQWNFGTVYKLTPTSGGSWRETTLYSFTGGLDGSTPSGNLYIDNATHKIYGTTLRGGPAGVPGYGVIFELTPGNPWTETVLHSFTGADGASPAGLVIHNGVFYGIAGGGHSNEGVVYALAPKPGGGWAQTVIYKFNSDTGTAFPSGGLAIDASGTVYGTTSNGPVGFQGTVYKLTRPASGTGAWTFTLLQEFTGGDDGGVPYSGVTLDAAGALYGTTSRGGNASCVAGLDCGTVFKLTPPANGTDPWTETVLYNFTSGVDGGNPRSNLIFDSNGALYGTSEAGGDLSCLPDPHFGCGTAFKLTPPSVSGGDWTESALYSFTARVSDGYYPTAGVVLLNNNLYGTTGSGGRRQAGTVFEVTQ